MFTREIPSAARTLRVLAHLLGYPDAQLLEHLPALERALQQEGALGPQRQLELQGLMAQLGRPDPLEVQARYVELFDRGRATALHLFEHVHGDSRDRGPAMVDLVRTYAQAGLYLREDELPDYLPVVLQFASSLEPRQAREFLGEMVHILQALFSALVERGSAYAAVLGALLDIAGEKPQRVPVPADEPLDASWAEPSAFDGCSRAGQRSSGAEQPIHLVKRTPATGAQPHPQEA